MKKAFRRYATAQEVADQFGLTAESVLRLGREGKLPRVCVSARTIRFDLDEVEKAIRQGRAAVAEVASV
jgi:predicted site-specific integrase-resolvase